MLALLNDMADFEEVEDWQIGGRKKVIEVEGSFGLGLFKSPGEGGAVLDHSFVFFN